MNSQGIDLAKAKADGRYIALDATEVLSKFMADGRPDRLRFAETVGDIITRASATSRDQNRRVVAFGEMVALLWAEGQAEAAIELEKLWNELAKTYSFSLHCAYPMQGKLIQCIQRMVIPPVFASYSTNGFTATKELSTLVGCQGDGIGWRQESFMNGRKRYGGKWARRTPAGYDIPPSLIIGGTKFRGYARCSHALPRR